MSITQAKAQHRSQQQRKLMHGLLMIAVSAVCVYMIADLWPGLRYDLSSQAVRDLGRAEGLDLKSLNLREDSFVRVKGITNNRGATVKGGQVSSRLLSERWYRQLAGSAIFLEIEVGDDEAERERFGMFTEVKVQGRLRFLRAHSDYANVIAFFKQHFNYEVPDYAVVITVDRVPGGSLRTLYAVMALTLVMLINIAVFVLVLRKRPVIDATQPEPDDLA